MTTTLKESVRAYYQSFSLSSRQLNHLESLEREHRFRAAKAPAARSWFWPIAALTAGIFLVFYFRPVPEHELSPRGIANEIAYNHNKTLSLEFQGKSIPEIRPHFSKLDFNLVTSMNNRIPDLSLVGGRYCSINKQLAAQLRLMEANSKEPLSWYQLPLPPNQKGFDKATEVYSNGVRVIMWSEKGVLHGLAAKQ